MTFRPMIRATVAGTLTRYCQMVPRYQSPVGRYFGRFRDGLCDSDVRQSWRRFSERFQPLRAASVASVYDTIVRQLGPKKKIIY
jgi:hypothetical protein